MKKLLIILSVCAILSGCSTFSKHKNTNGNMDADQPQTYGLGEDDALESGPTSGELGQRVFYFSFDSNRVNNEDIPSLQAHADYLNSHLTASVLVAGHTDERGSREYNMGLGERRAKAVLDILKLYNIKRSQIRFISYGEERPAEMGHDEVAYSKNRRVVIFYEND